MDFDFTSVVDFLKLVFMNKYTFVAAVGVFVGWNLPQPAAAKYIQDKIVEFVGLLWNKLRSNKDE